MRDVWFNPLIRSLSLALARSPSLTRSLSLSHSLSLSCTRAQLGGVDSELSKRRHEYDELVQAETVLQEANFKRKGKLDDLQLMLLKVRPPPPRRRRAHTYALAPALCCAGASTRVHTPLARSRRVPLALGGRRAWG